MAACVHVTWRLGQKVRSQQMQDWTRHTNLDQMHVIEKGAECVRQVNAKTHENLMKYDRATLVGRTYISKI